MLVKETVRAVRIRGWRVEPFRLYKWELLQRIGHKNSYCLNIPSRHIIVEDCGRRLRHTNGPRASQCQNEDDLCACSSSRVNRLR